MSASNGPDFEAITTERSRVSSSILDDDGPSNDPRATIIDTRERAACVDPSASTDEATVEQFLTDTDFDSAYLLAVEIPVAQTRCYTVAVESVSTDDDRVTVSATVEREYPECLDAPTVLTSFVRVERRPTPTTVSLELDDEALGGGS